MTITTDDCKALLACDPELAASGSGGAKPWKRLSKKSGPNGPERIFQHASSGRFAKVVESGGAIHIAATGATEAELSMPARQRAAPPAASPIDEAASKFHPAMAPAPARAIAAKAVEAMLARFDDDGDDGESAWRRAEKKCLAADPTALANQFTFAMQPMDDDDPDEDPIAIITPTKYWAEENCCYDQGSMIGHLLPDGSDDLNECGTWQIPGFEPTALAMHLLSIGFVWDPKFQELIDHGAGGSGLDAMAPILEGRALAAATPAGPAARAPRI